MVRLIKLIPGEGQLADEGRRVVAEVALAHGLVGEARRLLDEIGESRRDAVAWRLAARLAATDEDSAAETAALRRPARHRARAAGNVRAASVFTRAGKAIAVAAPASPPWTGSVRTVSHPWSARTSRQVTQSEGR